MEWVVEYKKNPEWPSICLCVKILISLYRLTIIIIIEVKRTASTSVIMAVLECSA